MHFKEIRVLDFTLKVGIYLENSFSFFLKFHKWLTGGMSLTVFEEGRSSKQHKCFYSIHLLCLELTELDLEEVCYFPVSTSVSSSLFRKLQVKLKLNVMSNPAPEWLAVMTPIVLIPRPLKDIHKNEPDVVMFPQIATVWSCLGRGSEFLWKHK